MMKMPIYLSAKSTHRLKIPLWLLTEVSQFEQALVKGHYPSQVTQACSGVNKTKTKKQPNFHSKIKGLCREKDDIL